MDKTLALDAIYQLAKDGRWDVVLSMWKFDQSLGARCARFIKPTSGWTFLHQSCYFGNTEASKQLITLGADMNLVDKIGGDNPIKVAEARGHSALVTYLRSRQVGSLWQPQPDPELWPSSDKFSEARKIVIGTARTVAYGGGTVDLHPGQEVFIDNNDRVLVGWHGTVSPPSGMDAESML